MCYKLRMGRNVNWPMLLLGIIFLVPINYFYVQLWRTGNALSRSFLYQDAGILVLDVILVRFIIIKSLKGESTSSILKSKVGHSVGSQDWSARKEIITLLIFFIFIGILVMFIYLYTRGA